MVNGEMRAFMIERINKPSDSAPLPSLAVPFPEGWCRSTDASGQETMQASELGVTDNDPLALTIACRHYWDEHFPNEKFPPTEEFPEGLPYFF